MYSDGIMITIQELYTDFYCIVCSCRLKVSCTNSRFAVIRGDGKYLLAGMLVRTVSLTSLSISRLQIPLGEGEA